MGELTNSRVFFDQGGTVTEAQVAGLVYAALDGGVGYWARIEEYVYPAGKTAADFGYIGHLRLPLAEGGAVILADVDTKPDFGPVRLDRKSLRRGLRVLEHKHPEHFASLLEGNADAKTADALVQCVAFGEAIFG